MRWLLSGLWQARAGCPLYHHGNRAPLHAGRDLIGVMVIIFTFQTSVVPTNITLIMLGVFGGLFVVPLNALLQKRGKETVGAGNAIAVQNMGKTVRCC